MRMRPVIISICCFFIHGIVARDVEPYKYVAQQEAYYKVHLKKQSWREAFYNCSLDGSSLFYPRTSTEAKQILGLLSNFTEIWVGAHNLFAKTVYVDLNGTDISEYYAPWMHGKPSEVNDTGRCIAMNLYGGLVDRSCETLRPFVCKKSIYHPTFNSVCNTPYSAYVPNENFTRCYKFLTNRITWTEGFEICNEESSYLFIPNDEEEINLITNGVENVKEEYGTVLIAVGLHNMFKDDMYLTIHGQKIEVVDNQWQDGEPNIRPNENCLFLSSRKLADYFCNNHDLLSYVVCERDIVDINIPGTNYRNDQLTQSNQ